MLDTWEGGWDSGKPNVLLANLARSDESSDSSRFAFYHSFERPTRTKVTKGSLGQLKFLHLTTVLSLRHSGARVDRRRAKFAFYHSFERNARQRVFLLLSSLRWISTFEGSCQVLVQLSM